MADGGITLLLYSIFYDTVKINHHLIIKEESHGTVMGRTFHKGDRSARL